MSSSKNFRIRKIRQDGHIYIQLIRNCKQYGCFDNFPLVEITALKERNQNYWVVIFDKLTSGTLQYNPKGQASDRFQCRYKNLREIYDRIIIDAF